MDTLNDNDAVIAWHRFDEDNPSTWPNDNHSRKTVLALVEWNRLNHMRSDGRPAVFYQAFVGEYHRCEDGTVRFLLDHGNGSLDEPGDEDADYVFADTAKWWTYLMTPEHRLADGDG